MDFAFERRQTPAIVGAEFAQTRLSLAAAIATDYMELARLFAARDTAARSVEVRSKTATLFALNARGVSLDSAMSRWLPLRWSLGPNVASITFRELLTHRAGFRLDSGLVFKTGDAAREQIRQGIQQVDQRVADYNNINFTILFGLLGLSVLVLSQYVEQLYARELLADGAGAGSARGAGSAAGWGEACCVTGFDPVTVGSEVVAGEADGPADDAGSDGVSDSCGSGFGGGTTSGAAAAADATEFAQLIGGLLDQVGVFRNQAFQDFAKLIDALGLILADGGNDRALVGDHLD